MSEDIVFTHCFCLKIPMKKPLSKDSGFDFFNDKTYLFAFAASKERQRVAFFLDAVFL